MTPEQLDSLIAYTNAKWYECRWVACGLGLIKLRLYYDSLEEKESWYGFVTEHLPAITSAQADDLIWRVLRPRVSRETH